MNVVITVTKAAPNDNMIPLLILRRFHPEYNSGHLSFYKSLSIQAYGSPTIRGTTTKQNVGIRLKRINGHN